MNYIGPVIGAVMFALIMSLVREPARRTICAMLTAGLTGVYMSGGGFGVWELAFPLVAMPLAYRGLSSYPALAAVWLLHSGWDILHHLYGNPIWPFMPSSSFGCMIFDAVIAIWFLAGAPSPAGALRQPPRRAPAGPSRS
jgi:hypothetical protein